METYPRAAVERAMKIQEVILRAVAKKDHLGTGRRDHRAMCAADATMEGTLSGVRL